MCLTRREYRTLRDLIDLWEEEHVDKQKEAEVDSAELMINLAVEICEDMEGTSMGPVKVIH